MPASPTRRIPTYAAAMALSALTGVRGYRRPPSVPEVVEDVDVEGWIRWCVAGLVLFSGASQRATPTPPIGEASRVAERVLLELAVVRIGQNLTWISDTYKMARRTLRRRLSSLGLYPLRPETVAVLYSDVSGPSRT